MRTVHRLNASQMPDKTTNYGQFKSQEANPNLLQIKFWKAGYQSRQGKILFR